MYVNNTFFLIFKEAILLQNFIHSVANIARYKIYNQRKVISICLQMYSRSYSHSSVGSLINLLKQYAIKHFLRPRSSVQE
jgi:hypothetical protein